MSSLRNAVKRITHKERSQPLARAHLGFLEKHQDYKKRAVNYHRKEDRIKAMQRKASMKNPDEFYFGMHNAEVKDGSHQKTEEATRKELEEQIGAEAVKLMKEQDLTYVRLQKEKDSKKVQRLKESLHLIGNDGEKKKRTRHTIFVDSREQADKFDPAAHFDTAPELVDRAFNRPRKSKLRALALEQLGYKQDGEEFESAVFDSDEKPTVEDLKWQAKISRKVARTAAKARSNAYGELEARAKRAAAMELAEAHLVTEKLVAGKGRKRKIQAPENGKPAQYKWRRQRKR